MTDQSGWRFLDAMPNGFDAVLGKFEVRPLRDGAQARWPGGIHRANLMGGFHGGFLCAAAEQCLFLPLYLHGRAARDGVVVIDYNLQFLTNGDVEKDLIVDVALLRETGRLGFVRGEIRQDDTVLTAFGATLRKLGAQRASP